jgi:hypothetical protein
MKAGPDAIVSLTLQIDDGAEVEITDGGRSMRMEMSPISGRRLNPFGARIAELIAGARIEHVQMVGRDSDLSVRMVILWLDDRRAVTIRPAAPRGSGSFRITLRTGLANAEAFARRRTP